MEELLPLKANTLTLTLKVPETKIAEFANSIDLNEVAQHSYLI